MHHDKLNFGIIIRVFLSLLPILFGMPILATIFCAYNIAMSFLAFGPLTTLVSSLCAIAGAMFLSSSQGAGGELYGLSMGLQAVLCAWGCIFGLFKRKDFYYGLTLSTLGVLVPQLMYSNSIAHANGMSLADMLVPGREDLKLMITQTMGTFPQEMRDALPIGEETVGAISELVRNFTVMIIPSVLIISSLVLAYIVMWAVASPLRMKTNEKVHSFSNIKLPRVLVTITLILLFVLIYGVYGENTVIATVTLNMLIVFLTLAFFAGIALADFYIRKIVPIKFLRFVIHMLIALNFFPIYILAAFIDSFVNFRKLPRVIDKKGGGDYETKK